MTGKGTVKFGADVLRVRKNIVLNDTLHVPDLRTNLLSVGKITDREYEVHFRKTDALVLDSKGDVKLYAERIGDLYYAMQARRPYCGTHAEN